MKELWDLNKDEYDIVVEETAIRIFNVCVDKHLTYDDYQPKNIKNVFGRSLPMTHHNFRVKFLKDVENKRIEVVRNIKIEKILN